MRQTDVVNPLIEVAELAVALASARPPTLIDVRWTLKGDGAQAYAAGHLPGAAFVDLDTALAGPPGAGGRHPLPEPAVLQEALRAAGVDAGRPVVVYDAGGTPPTGAAARAWWVLRWAGHPDVRILDGGYAAWTADGRPVTDDRVEPAPGGFTVAPDHEPVIDAGAAAAFAVDGRLLDARVPARYRGEQEPVDPVAGHIPGALNQPAAYTVDDNGRLLDAGTLRERFEALGLEPDEGPVGAYCGSGVTAAQTVLALTVAGYTPVLYVGSWSDWITDENRPIDKA
ncbi:sulfurtransferase [Virgisporangium aliadipatigenens]|uniref:sulfurtransferase n=1 Tax=Virgisporangium aliadipatigenens TaxID=741659 RepID=UPI00194194F8|nr:sulfurtransferase [Virgisporangium aliadipatigenens]